MDFAVVQTAALGVFGRDIIVTRAGGSPVAGLRGIFRAKHESVDPQSGAVVLIDQPTLDVRLAEMPGNDIARGDLVTIPVQASFPIATDFEIIEVRKDGEGMAMCAMIWQG